MASPTPHNAVGQSKMTVAELMEYTKSALAEDADRQAQVSAVDGVVSHTGATLDLSHKQVTELPVEVIALIKDRVERLALSHNPAIAIPLQATQLTRLRYLNIRWNGLKAFPDAVLQLSGLEILDLSKNKITEVPDAIRQMVSLKFLAISRNKITRLPYVLGDMSSLSKLKCDENPLEFPPLEVLQPQPDRDMCQHVKKYLRMAAQREQGGKGTPDSEHSEGQLETPRPSKRPVKAPASGPQRFPVRPSISGFDNVPSPGSSMSPDSAPVVPLRSHARLTSTSLRYNVPGADMTRSLSTTSISSRTTKRHGLVPQKGSRALGSVSSMTSLSSLGAETDRSSQVTLKAAPLRLAGQHSRQRSSANSFLFPNPAAESSTFAKANDADNASRNTQVSKRLSTLREGSRQQPRTGASVNVKLAKRLPIILYKLAGPLNEILTLVREQGKLQKNLANTERLFASANSHVQELDRQTDRIAGNTEAQIMPSNSLVRHEEALRSVSMAAASALEAYARLFSDLKWHTKSLVNTADPFVFRILLLEFHMAMSEARNIIVLLGFKIRSRRGTLLQNGAKKALTQPHNLQQANSKAASGRTVTPTLSKTGTVPSNPRLKRVPTIIQSRPRGGLPPPTVSINSSRTNTMTSSTSAAPRSADPAIPPNTPGFPAPLTPNLRKQGPDTMAMQALPVTAALGHPGFRNTRTPPSQAFQAGELSDEEQFDRIWQRLNTATQIAGRCLRQCHADFTVRLDNANQTGQQLISQTWSLALSHCNTAITATTAMANRLKHVKQRLQEGPASWPVSAELDNAIYGGTSNKEFWTLSDNFIHSWTDLVVTVKAIGEGKYDHVVHDLNNLKRVMRDTQRAAKEVSRAVSVSSLYNSVIRNRYFEQMLEPLPSLSSMSGGPPNGGVSANGQHLPPGISTEFVSNSNNALLGGHASGSSGYNTIPATPLSAALGPAAQATVAQTPDLSYGSMTDYFPPSQPGTARMVGSQQQSHSRVDTVMQSQAPAEAWVGGRR